MKFSTQVSNVIEYCKFQYPPIFVYFFHIWQVLHFWRENSNCYYIVQSKEFRSEMQEGGGINQLTDNFIVKFYGQCRLPTIGYYPLENLNQKSNFQHHFIRFGAWNWTSFATCVKKVILKRSEMQKFSRNPWKNIF